MIRAGLLLLVFLAIPVASTWAQGDLDEIWEMVRNGKADEALARLEAIAVDRPEDPMVHFGLGRILHMTGEHARAVEHLEKCLALGPKEPWAIAWAHCDLGKAFMALGRNDVAETHIRKAIELDATANCTRSARQALARLTGDDPWGKGSLVGKPIPAFEFQGIAGDVYTPADFKGSATLLKFGPSW
jgi:tetratricopeptide (TPR) repeat protein